jgi:hypothetical protein
MTFHARSIDITCEPFSQTTHNGMITRIEVGISPMIDHIPLPTAYIAPRYRAPWSPCSPPLYVTSLISAPILKPPPALTTAARHLESSLMMAGLYALLTRLAIQLCRAHQRDLNRL